MSKLDAQRAMREAKYARDQARAKGAAQPRVSATPAPVAPPLAKKNRSAAATPAADGEKCGHRSMNGRTCTREQGHSEKNHRYS